LGSKTDHNHQPEGIMTEAKCEKFISKGQPKLRNLIFVEITEMGEITWLNTCPKDITLRLKNQTWGLKQRSHSAGDKERFGKRLPVEFFRIGARLRRFCHLKPGTIAVLDGSNEWQMAALDKIIRRLIRWGVLVQPKGAVWPRFASKSDESEAMIDLRLDGGAGLV
jgi:hypothetical protein